MEDARIRAQMNKERRARIRRHFQALLTKEESAKLPRTAEPMTEEERDLVARWGVTDDFQEFMEIGRKLFPEASEEDLIKAFDGTTRTLSRRKMYD